MLSQPNPGIKLTPESLREFVGHIHTMREITDHFHCSRGEAWDAARVLVERGTHVVDGHYYPSDVSIRRKPPEFTIELLIEYVKLDGVIPLPGLARQLMCSLERIYEVAEQLEARGTHVISAHSKCIQEAYGLCHLRACATHSRVGPPVAFPHNNRKIRCWRGRMAVSKRYGRASYAVDGLPRPVEEIKAILGEKYGIEFE